MSNGDNAIGFPGRQAFPLAPDPSLLVSLLKEGLAVTGSNQYRQKNRVPHPIRMENAALMMLAVDLQMTCIHTKRDAIVGLGFESDEKRKEREKPPMPDPAMQPAAPVKKIEGDSEISKVEEVLDPICEYGFQSLMSQCGEDYGNTGNGYFEVVRDGTSVVKLWHMQAPCVYVNVEADGTNYHYEVDDGNGTKKFAKYGDVERLRKVVQQERITELVHFKLPTPFSAYYGIPDWLACTPWLELAQMLQGYHFDFFQNRAVPDLLAVISGYTVGKEEFDALASQIKETVGEGKRHRSLLVNLKNVNGKLDIHRLASETTDTFESLWNTVQLKLVSSHRVPPLLAGLSLPGKMAAANELPNALVAFQNLYVQQHQRVFEQTLRRTLALDFPELKKEFNLRRITDYYDLGKVDTMSRMKQPAAEAEAEGRNLADGLKK